MSRGVVFFALSLTLAAGCGEDDEPRGEGRGGGGAGGNTSGGNSNGAGRDGGGRGGAPHRELCGIALYGGCTDGIVHGEFGYSCTPITVTCENGCSASPTSVAQYTGNDWRVVSENIKAALCESPGDGGAGGTGGAG